MTVQRVQERLSAKLQHPLKPHHLARPHALVGREHDAQRVDRVLEMIREIDLAADRLQEQPLLALAELLMAGLVLGRVDFVGMGEGAVGVERGVMDAQRVGPGMGVVIGGLRRRAAVSLATIDTQPFGPIMSFTKKAVSLIIGPQPASYQPTEPSSKTMCRWP